MNLNEKSEYYRRLALFGLFTALISLLIGLLLQPQNSLWAIPIIFGYVGGNLANTKSRVLAKMWSQRFGYDSEEYY